MMSEIIDVEFTWRRKSNPLSQIWLYLGVLLWLSAGVYELLRPEDSFDVQIHDSYIITSVPIVFLLMGFLCLLLHFWYKKFKSRIFGWVHLGIHPVFALTFCFNMIGKQVQYGLYKAPRETTIVEQIMMVSGLLLILFYLVFPVYLISKVIISKK